MSFEDQKQLCITMLFNNTLYPISYSYWFNSCLYMFRVEKAIIDHINRMEKRVNDFVSEILSQNFDMPSSEEVN